jgi:hypothetical protein
LSLGLSEDRFFIISTLGEPRKSRVIFSNWKVIGDRFRFRKKGQILIFE